MLAVIILIFIAIVLGDNFLEGGYSAFYHIVGRLKDRHMLKPYAGGGNDPCKQIIVTSREFYQLVSDSHYKRKQEKSYYGSYKCGRYAACKRDGYRVYEK